MHVWDWFNELDETRNVGMALNAITHQEISAWAEGMRINVSPLERQALRAIDRAYIKFQNSKHKESDK